jgi:excisionase family DNA binding protein
MVALADSPLLTIEEYARLVRVSPATVRRWARAGEVPAVKAGKSWRIDTTGTLPTPSTSRRGPHPTKDRLR